MNQEDKSIHDIESVQFELQEKIDTLERRVSTKERENENLRKELDVAKCCNDQGISSLYAQLNERDHKIKQLQAELNRREQVEKQKLDNIDIARISTAFNQYLVGSKKEQLNLFQSSAGPSTNQAPEQPNGTSQQHTEQLNNLQRKLERVEEENERLKWKCEKKKEIVARLEKERDCAKEEVHKKDLQIVQLASKLEHVEKEVKSGIDADCDGPVVIKDQLPDGTLSRIKTKQGVKITYANPNASLPRSSSAPSSCCTLSRYLQEQPQSTQTDILENLISVSQVGRQEGHDVHTQTDLEPPAAAARPIRQTEGQTSGESSQNQQPISAHTQTVEINQPTNAADITAIVDDADLDGEQTFHSSQESL